MPILVTIGPTAEAIEWREQKISKNTASSPAGGMSFVVKAPLHYEISLFTYVLNNQNPGYKFAQKIL